MNTVLLDIAHAEVIAGFVTSLSFPAAVRFFWPWHESSWGWNTVTLELSIAGCLLPGFLFLVFHVTSAALSWVEIVSLGLVVFNVLWRVVMIWRIQREGAARDKEDVA